MASSAKKANPHFTILALSSFIASFAVARVFTTLNPNVVIMVGTGIHIHHFWFGILLLAVGGWLGIINRTERADQLAAVLYGAGLGLIADEFGLLLTWGNYWTTLTYTVVGILLAFVILAGLLIGHRATIRAELRRVSRIDAVLYGGILLAMVSVAFLTTTSSSLIVAVSIVLGIIALAMILFFAINWIRLRSKTKEKLATHKAK
jgi:FtsH-binding integral membrane protein